MLTRPAHLTNTIMDCSYSPVMRVVLELVVDISSDKCTALLTVSISLSNLVRLLPVNNWSKLFSENKTVQRNKIRRFCQSGFVFSVWLFANFTRIMQPMKTCKTWILFKIQSNIFHFSANIGGLQSSLWWYNHALRLYCLLILIMLSQETWPHCTVTPTNQSLIERKPTIFSSLFLPRRFTPDCLSPMTSEKFPGTFLKELLQYTININIQMAKTWIVKI